MSQNESSNPTTTGTSVLAEVATALQASTGEVRSRLVKALTERELVKRVDLLDKALVRRAQLQGELNNLRFPMKKHFKMVEGKMQEVEALYSQEEVKKFEEERKQFDKKVKDAQEKLAKFDKTLEAAFVGDPNDSEGLTKAFASLAKQMSGGGESEKAGE